MTIKMCDMVKMTPKTCTMNEAVKGYVCNKTIFLFQEFLQLAGCKTWTVDHYEKDRFGLLNGLMYLLKKSEDDCIEIYFSSTKTRSSCFIKMYKEMSYREISEIVDRMCDVSECVVYS